jgi:hypothetical protein
MIWPWIARPGTRLVFAGGALFCGVTIAMLLQLQHDIVPGIVFCSIALAALVGAGKLASP